MKPFEKYMELKKKCEEKGIESPALNQYLHIAQVMKVEEESYRKHRSHMNKWLKNIEDSVNDDIRKLSD